MGNPSNKHRVGDRLGDWVRQLDEEHGVPVWFRDRVTTGPYKPSWTLHSRRGEAPWLELVVALDQSPGWQTTFVYRLKGGAIRLDETHQMAVTEEAEPAPIYRQLGGRELEAQVADELTQPFVQMMLPPEWRATALKTRRSGRRPVDDLELAELCEAYLAACADAPRSPMVELKRRDGRSVNTLRALMQTASRERGLFEYTGHGKVGGELTEKAKALLAIRDERTGPNGKR